MGHLHSIAVHLRKDRRPDVGFDFSLRKFRLNVGSLSLDHEGFTQSCVFQIGSDVGIHDEKLAMEGRGWT
jgi:hypothetical protein